MVFSIEKLSIPGLAIITSELHGDPRGYFLETYKRSEFIKLGMDVEFVQDNISLSKKGTIRGLHYQLEPYSQGKLLRAVTGKIFEVAVDLRNGSPTFGKWEGVMLTPESGKQFWIPSGFAAGMATLEDSSLLAYKTTEEYSKEHEMGIRWDDPAIGIKWPGEIGEPTISEKDMKHPLLKDAVSNFVY